MSAERQRIDDFMALLTCDPTDHVATIGLIARVQARRSTAIPGNRPPRKLLGENKQREARSRDG
jgi:hypothetical protein